MRVLVRLPAQGRDERRRVRAVPRRRSRGGMPVIIVLVLLAVLVVVFFPGCAVLPFVALFNMPGWCWVAFLAGGLVALIVANEKKPKGP
jgi:hypothetical protein